MTAMTLKELIESEITSMSKENLSIEQEITLVNEIAAHAAINGGDSGGTYDSNGVGLAKAMKRWIRAKGLDDSYHVIYRQFLCTPDCGIEELSYYKKEGRYLVMQIVPRSEKGREHSYVDPETVEI